MLGTQWKCNPFAPWESPVLLLPLAGTSVVLIPPSHQACDICVKEDAHYWGTAHIGVLLVQEK